MMEKNIWEEFYYIVAFILIVHTIRVANNGECYSWTQIQGPYGTDIYNAIVVDKNDPNIIYMGGLNRFLVLTQATVVNKPKSK